MLGYPQSPRQTARRQKGEAAMPASTRLVQKPISAPAPKIVMHENATKCTVSANRKFPPARPERAQRVEAAHSPTPAKTKPSAILSHIARRRKTNPPPPTSILDLSMATWLRGYLASTLPHRAPNPATAPQSAPTQRAGAKRTHSRGSIFNPPSSALLLDVTPGSPSPDSPPHPSAEIAGPGT